MEQPNYKDILKQKIDYYGKTEAAYEFAAEQYALLYHLWATQGAVMDFELDQMAGVSVNFELNANVSMRFDPTDVAGIWADLP